MPLYEYECEANHHRFEVIQKYSDPPVATCPTCGSPVQKLLSSPAIQFKGSGWYITDYARAGKSDGAGKSESGGGSSSKSESGSASADTKGESKSESKTDSKTESKSETKSESKPTTAPSSS